MTSVSEPLLERETALAEIDAALAATGEGIGRTVVVTGPPGIGKTRLLNVAAARAEQAGVQVFRARGADSEHGFAFGCELQLFDRLALDDALFSGAAALARPVFDGSFLRGAGGPLPSAIHGLFWFVVGLAQRGPLALILDDLHAADDPTLSFLLYLHRRLADLPVALITGSRLPERIGRPLLSEFAHAPEVRLVHLAPLSDDAVSELIRSEFDPSATAEFCLECSRLTGGNPFYVKEVTGALRADGLELDEQAAHRLEAVEPRVVSRSVLLRLGRLSPSAHALARACAVLGPDTPIQLAAKVASLAVDEALVAADRLTAAAIMRPGQPLSFIHPLIATAVNGDLSASERTLLNRRAADALAAQGGPVEAIAPHLLWTPPAGDPRTIATLRAAADHARLAGSPQTAAQYLERALLEPAPTDGERAELLIELGRAEVGTAPERAGAHLRQAIALGANEPAAARLALELGRALYVAGKHEEAARTFLSASERVPVEEPLRDELRAWLASASIFVEPLREIGQQITLELASAPPAEPTVGQRAILALAGAGLVISGAPHRDAARFAKLAWADGAQLAAETCDGYTWMHVTAVHLWSGHPMAGLPIIEAVIADARLRGSVMAFATASFIKAGAEFFLGQLQDALADLEQVMLIHRRDGWNMFIGTAVAQHVEVLLEVGDLSAARSALTTLDPARFGDSAEGAALRYAAGLVAQAQGSTAAAAAAFDTAIEMLARTQFRAIRLVPAWRAAGLAHLALGNRGRAAALVAEGEQIARNAEVHDMVAAMLLVRARLEDDAVATTTLREAVELAGASDSRLEHARALIALGSHLRRTNQRRAAQQPLLDGLELAAGCGAAPLEAAARQELAVLGSRPRRAARSGAEALTASELRVARLAAGGLTNRAIAEALFVTPKTIEYHLRNAYMKLDVSSRKELAAALS